MSHAIIINLYPTLFTYISLLLQTNTFQCIIATNKGLESYVIFLYAHGKIQWTTADRDGGVDGNEAVARINAGDGVNHFTIPGSSTPDIINIDETSNVGIPGMWMFQIGKRMLCKKILILFT